MQSLALYLALSGLTAALPAPEAIRVPLPRRSSGQLADGSADLLSFFSSLNRTLAKHHAGSLAPMDGLKNLATEGLLKRASSGSIPLVDQVEMGQDELYYGSGQVGSQTFTFDFDTGSSDIFIPGPSCTTAQGCPGKVKYNQKGTDRHMTTSVTYGSGQVSGEDYYDSVTIAGLTAKKQNVISLTQAQGFSGSNSDGLLGMGFSTIAESKSPTYFETLISQGSVAAQEFSFYLGRAASNTGSKSELTIGGRDSKKFTGAVTSVPVTQKGYWQVAIDGISANGQQALLGAGQAAIDTGTTIVLGPTADLLSLFANVPGAIPLPQPSLGSIPITLFAVPCNQIPTINLGFAGKKFAINPLDLNMGQLFGPALPFLGDVPLPLIDLLGSGACLLNVAAADINPTSPLYIVGDTFLKNWYSIFSYAGNASVNFAKAV